jgi:hypothetical protein
MVKRGDAMKKSFVLSLFAGLSLFAVGPVAAFNNSSLLFETNQPIFCFVDCGDLQPAPEPRVVETQSGPILIDERGGMPVVQPDDIENPSGGR